MLGLVPAEGYSLGPRPGPGQVLGLGLGEVEGFTRARQVLSEDGDKD